MLLQHIVNYRSPVGEYYGLDEVGSVFFEAVLYQREPAKVLLELRSRYPDVDLMQLEKDLHQFLRKLVRYRILGRV